MAFGVRLLCSPGRSEPAGQGRFVLRPVGGRYVLPQIEVVPLDRRPGTLLDLRATVADPASDLGLAVVDAWPAPSPGPVTTPVLAPVGVPVDGPGTATSLVVTWHGRYAVESDPPEEFEVIVELHFQSEQAAPHPGFVAIDFGTSNSTVVLYDQDKRLDWPLGRKQAVALRDGLVALIEDPELPDVGIAQLEDLAARVVRSVTGRSGTGAPRADLVAALCDESYSDPRKPPVVLYDVLLATERELATRSQPLKSWLTSGLHRCYDTAFAVPGLDRLRVHPVELDPVAGGFELPSRVEVTGLHPLRAELVVDDGAFDNEQGRVHLGLKQYLGNPEPRDVAVSGEQATVSTDDLVRAALEFLVRRTEEFVERNPRTLGTGRINQAVVTFPTVAPPGIRHKLRALLHDEVGIAQVHATYDEAVAAVMFFLLRDFGGEFEVGVEAVKARFHAVEVAGSTTAWTQNLLVVDVGGGTTDIALVRLTLTDETPTDDGADPRWYGRYYVLTPAVFGSTGDLQLGGEYLTLRVFRWLKAKVADTFLTEAAPQLADRIRELAPRFRDSAAYKPGSLVDAVLADDEDEAVLGYVNAVVPTRWADHRDDQQAFWLLWQLAERAKVALGKPGAESFDVTATDLRQIANAVAAASGGPVPSLPDVTVTLDVATFGELVREPLAEVMKLATELVASRFASDPAQQLDRVILTGKTSVLEQVRQALTTQFGKGANDQVTVNWDPSGVRIERDYSKLATAIGACWAESIRQKAVDPKRARPQMREGKTVLDVDIDNLFFTLPCTFSVGQLELFEPRLSVGSRLSQIDEEPVGKVRSDIWDPLYETVDVYRMRTEKEAGPRWGTFKFREHAHDLGVQDDLDPAVWPQEISTQLEVNQELDLWLHLCRGTPHYVVDGPEIDVLAAIREVHGRDHLGPDGLLADTLPGDILVDSLIAGSATSSGVLVFAADTPLVFDKVFYDDDSSPQPTDGLLAAQDLESPARRRGDGATERWTFTLRYPGGEKEIGTLPRPAHAGQFPTRFRVVLDRRGRLRVLAGELRYRAAVGMKDVEETGRVLTFRFPPYADRQSDVRNPFNGTH